LNDANRRKYPRIDSKCTVEYTVGKQTFHAHATTLGGGGLLLKEPPELSPGTETVVRFRPAKHLPVIQAKSTVIYHLPGRGMGIEFREILPEHREILLRLIYHRTIDKRREPRADFATQIESKECTSLAHSRNLSVGGMFIETASPLPNNTDLSVRFNLNDNGPAIVTRAQVSYCIPKLGMGVYFIDLQREDRKRIELFLAQNLMPAPAATAKVGSTT